MSSNFSQSEFYLTVDSLHAGLFFMCFVVIFSLKSSFKKNLLGIPSASNSLDSAQARQFVGPDLGQSCLQS